MTVHIAAGLDIIPWQEVIIAAVKYGICRRGGRCWWGNGYVQLVSIVTYKTKWKMKSGPQPHARVFDVLIWKRRFLKNPRFSATRRRFHLSRCPYVHGRNDKKHYLVASDFYPCCCVNVFENHRYQSFLPSTRKHLNLRLKNSPLWTMILNIPFWERFQSFLSIYIWTGGLTG